MEEKKNTCQHCQIQFTPAFRHPNQTCCGRRKCVLARRAKLQKRKMDEDPDYRDNQKLANEKWREENRDYWRKYRKGHPDSTLKNRMMQRIRNMKRNGTKPPAVKVNLDELVAKMHLVDPAERKRKISFWLLSETAEIAPIEVVLVGRSNGLRPNRSSRPEPMDTGRRIPDVQGEVERRDCKDALG